MIIKIKRMWRLLILFKFTSNGNAFATDMSNTNKLSPLEKLLNFSSYIRIKYGTILLIIGGIVLLSREAETMISNITIQF